MQTSHAEPETKAVNSAVKPIICRRPDRPSFSEMSFQELFDWNREKRGKDKPMSNAVATGEYVPKPPGTQADFEQYVYGMANSGIIRIEGAEKLLAAAARARRGETLPARPMADVAAETAARNKAALDEALLMSAIPEQFWGLRLSSNPFVTENGIPFDFSEDTEGINLRAFKACRVLAHGWQPGARGITLRSEGVGVGKTLLAYGVLVYLLAHHKGREGANRIRCQSVKAKDLLYCLRASYGATWEKNPGVMSTEQVRQKYQVGPDVLMLDDLGKENVRGGEGGEWARGEMLDLLDYRMDHKLTTIITTNLTAPDIEARYGSAFASRLLGRSPMREMTGADYRQAGFNDEFDDPFAEETEAGTA